MSHEYTVCDGMMSMINLLRVVILIWLFSTSTMTGAQVLSERTFAAEVTGQGVRITVTLPQRSFPHDALVRTTVKVQNTSFSDLVQVERFRDPCAPPNPTLRVLDSFGRTSDPLAVRRNPVLQLTMRQSGLAGCGVVPGGVSATLFLAPRKSAIVYRYLVLRTGHMFISMSFNRYRGYDPRLHRCKGERAYLSGSLTPIRLTVEPKPRVTEYGSPPRRVIVRPTRPVHGNLIYTGWWTCAPRKSHRIGPGGFGWVDAGGMRINFDPGCGKVTSVHIVAGWLNHAVAFIDYRRKRVGGLRERGSLRG